MELGRETGEPLRDRTGGAQAPSTPITSIVTMRPTARALQDGRIAMLLLLQLQLQLDAARRGVIRPSLALR